MRLVFVIGTRPEAIKLAPIIVEARKRGILSTIITTGQHPQMVDPMLRVFSLNADHKFHVDFQKYSLGSITAQIMNNVDTVMKNLPYDYVIVQGDTVSTFVGALLGFYYKIPVAHVEAGLRTNNKHDPFPEEMVRVLVSKLADYHFCPTANNKHTLVKEGISKDICYITGNTVIDAMYDVLSRTHAWHDLDLAKICEYCWSWNKRIILLTLHRRENWSLLEDILKGIKDSIKHCDDVHVIYPVHPNPFIQETVDSVFTGDNITLLPPLVYDDFINLMNRSYLVVTDSGGIQEEAPYLHKPVIVVRRSTERQEAEDKGLVTVVAPHPSQIKTVIRKHLHSHDFYEGVRSKAVDDVYGDGKASERIINILSGGN